MLLAAIPKFGAILLALAIALSGLLFHPAFAPANLLIADRDWETWLRLNI